jgi:PAS domain S-box-containing protein
MNDNGHSNSLVSEAELLAAIVQSSSDAIITKDLDGIVTSWNRSAESLFGYSAVEAIGQSVTILIPADRLEEEPGILQRIRRGEKIEHFETVRKTKDGRLVDISLTISPVHDASGKIVGASKIARDISERKRSEAEFSRFLAIIESSSDAIITKDLNGVIQTWNQGAENIFGYTAEEAIGKPITILMPEDRVDEEPNILARIRRGEHVDHYETIRQDKYGKLVEISLNVSPVRDERGNIIGASKIARDITEHNRLRSTQREAHVMQRLVETQEAERRRIARDLHDQIGQYITGMRMTIEGLIPINTNEFVEVELLKLKNVAHRIDREVSYLTWELRPTDLEDRGLEEALDSFVKEWSSNSGIEADFHFVGGEIDGRLPTLVETNLYRITQEALNNTAKHARASRVSVLMHRQKSKTFIIIEDNGIGFDVSSPPSAARGHGYGLRGMRERVEVLNGKLQIESSSDHGTTITITIQTKSDRPLPSE